MKFTKFDPVTGKGYALEAPSEEEIEHEWQGFLFDQRKAEARKQGSKAPGAVQGEMAVLNGVLMGFGDEAVGAGTGLYNLATGGKGGYSEGYGLGRDYTRGAVDAYRKEHPVLGPVADVSGALATAPLAVLNAVGKGGRIARTAAAAGTGAVTGAIQGAGEAESTDDMIDRVLMGGAIGGALPVGMGGIGAVKDVLKNQVLPRFSGAAATDLARQRVGNAISRDSRTGQQVETKMGELGNEATIADSAGENTLGLLDTMATLPGKTKDEVEQLIRNRQITRPDRLDAVSDLLSGGRRADKTYEALQRAKEAASGPLYAKVDAMKVPITQTLVELSERPAMKRALEQARINVADDGRTLTADMTSGQLPLRYWDDVKKGLDDVIRGIKRNGPNSNAAASTLENATKVKSQLVRELDAISTDPNTGRSVYKDARDAFAGPAALQSAIEDGRTAMTMSAADIERATFGMSKSELKAFRIGAAEALSEKMGGRPGQNQMLNIWVDRNTRQQMAALFGPGKVGKRNYQESVSILENEGHMKKIEGVGRGSQTASREARVEDVNAQVLADAAATAKNAVTLNVPGFLRSAQSLGGRLGTPEVVRDEIGRILMERGVPAQEQLRAMAAIIQSMRMGNSQSAAIQGVLGGSGTSVLNP